jgi:hypothetical protein
MMVSLMLKVRKTLGENKGVRFIVLKLLLMLLLNKWEIVGAYRVY